MGPASAAENFVMELVNRTGFNLRVFACFSVFRRTGAVGGGDEGGDGDDKEKAEEEERERQEAIKEAEDRRKEKHRKMEEEREKMRQDIRDKVSAIMGTKNNKPQLCPVTNVVEDTHKNVSITTTGI